MTRPIRLMTVAPGHFHAALVQKEMLPGVHPLAHVYAPLDDDLVAHVGRIAGFNQRADDPTRWRLDVRAGGDFLGRFLREQPGNAVVLAGRNKPKAGYLLAAAAAGLHTVADKPWVIAAADLPWLEAAFHEADLRDAVLWDVMTERWEVTNRLARELTRDPGLFGNWLPGSPAEPALELASVHHLKKLVAGQPLRRPAWWFDPLTAGDAIADVGTHLADLALWLLFPDQPIDYRTEVAVLDADRRPLPLSLDQFRDLTGLAGFPPEVQTRWVQNGELLYQGNGLAVFAVRGVHAGFAVGWEFEAAPSHGDTQTLTARGDRATVAVAYDPAFGPAPQVFVTAADPAEHHLVFAAAFGRCDDLQPDFPGIAVDDLGDRIHIAVPDALRTGHEDHFAEVMREFTTYFHNPRAVPAWERPNLLAKYYITTTASEMARQKP